MKLEAVSLILVPNKQSPKLYYCHNTDTLHNQINPPCIKTQSFHNPLNKTPFDFIKGFTLIKRSHHETILTRCLWFRQCINLKATRTLSLITLSQVKALWFSMIIWGSKDLRWLARVLEMSLQITLHRKISHSLGVIFFGGMMAMFVLLISVIGKLEL